MRSATNNDAILAALDAVLPGVSRGDDAGSAWLAASAWIAEHGIAAATSRAAEFRAAVLTGVASAHAADDDRRDVSRLTDAGLRRRSLAEVVDTRDEDAERRDRIADLRARLDAAWPSLSGTSRMFLHARYRCGMPVTRIAARFNLSRDTVRRRLAAAVAELRTLCREGRP